MFCYKRKNTFMKRAKKEWKHDIVYDPRGHNDLYVCIDLLYDFKGYDPKGHGYRCGRFDIVNDPNVDAMYEWREYQSYDVWILLKTVIKYLIDQSTKQCRCYITVLLGCIKYTPC